jgi:large subunit ribosomal protein L9
VEVILLERIAKLGDLGATVRVKRGFGRNYLIPQKKALPATTKNIAYFEARRAVLEQEANERLHKARDRALTLEGIAISVAARAGEEGKLFGSVGPHEIIDALKASGHVVAKNEVRLEGPIRQLGEHEVSLHLHEEEVIVKIRVSIVSA